MKWIIILILLLIVLGLWYKTEQTKDTLSTVGSATYKFSKETGGIIVDKAREELKDNNITINSTLERINGKNN